MLARPAAHACAVRRTNMPRSSLVIYNAYLWHMERWSRLDNVRLFAIVPARGGEGFDASNRSQLVPVRLIVRRL